MIYILTGAIRTGKTTALLNWITDRNDADGLLCPADDNGKRFFLKVKSKESFSLEVNSDNVKDTITIGSFRFLKSAFDEANHFLSSMSSEMKNQYLIIDELGKLELKSQGLHPAAECLIHNYIHNSNQHLIIVVRESLLEEITNHYNISKYLVLKKEDLESL